MPNKFVVFNGTDQNNLTSLWITDGTSAGTSELSVTGASANGLNPTNFTQFGSEVAFEGTDANGHNGLWVTDGTSAGTSELSVSGAASGGVNPQNMAAFGGKLFFEGADAAGNLNLWVSDGTSGGTSELSIPGAATTGFHPQDMTVFGNELLLGGYDTNNHYNLWVSDGTAAGTSELQVAGTFPLGLIPQDLTPFGTKVLFNGDDQAGHNNLWLTDGTGTGTSELSVAGASANGLNPLGITVLGSKVLFEGVDASNQTGLWVSDGTAAGTTELAVANAYSGGLAPFDLTVLGNNVFFEGQDTSGQYGLWKTDGTAAGTSELSIGAPGYNTYLASNGKDVLFDGNYNLWVTDGTSAGTSELSAAGASPTLAPSFMTSVAFPVSAATSTLVATPGSVTADGVSTTTLTVTVEDAHGNAVAGTAVTLSGNGSGNSFGTISGTTNAQGVFTTTLASTLAQTETITATEGSVHESTSVTFNPGAPSATTSTLVATPGSVTADGVSTTTLTVKVEDAQGNLVPNAAVTLSGSGAGDVFGATSGTTNAQGVFTTTLSSTTAQAADTVTATEGSVHESTSVTFNPGAPSATTSTVVASPGSVTADGVSTTTVTVTVEDAHGNLVPNAAVTLSSSGAGDFFGGTSGTTNANGVFTTTLSSTTAQATDTITATEGSVHESTSVTFNPGAPSATTSTLVASPGSVTADGVSTTTLTVTVEDAHGNLVPNAAVTLSGSGAANSFGTISGTTNANGVFTTTLASTLAQTETITATEGSVQETTSVTFNPGAPSATTSTLVASPGSVTADGVSTTTLTVTVEDAHGNLVPNAAVTLSGNGTANSFGTISGTTNANGVFTTTLASTLAQTETITATEGSVQETTSVTFNPGAPSATTSTLVASPGSVTADGVSTATLTVTVEDAHGNLVPNAAVTLSGSGAGDVFGATSGTTNAQGVFTTTLSSTTVQAADTITATEGSVRENTSVKFGFDTGPVETVANVTATHGQSFAGSSLFTYSDPFSRAATQYDVWDTGSGGGHFTLNGATLGANQDNIITAAQLAQLTYQSGSGADTLWVRANDGIVWGAWSNSFTVTAPVDPGPVETVANITATHGQSFAGSSLFTYSDPFNSAATQYDVWDTGSGGGHFALNGATLGANQDNIITAAQLAQLTYQSGSGADTLWVRANDGTSWGAWSNSFTVTAPVDPGPVETVANITATHGQSFAGSSLFTYSDPFNSAATQYDVWDIGSGGGHFALNGTSLGANQDNIITAAQLAQLTYQSGSGADTLWVRANDGTSWGAWSNSFTVTAPVDPGPVETVANITATHGQSFAGSSLFTYSDPFNSAATQYDVWDTGSGGGHFALNGATLGANQDNIITAAQLAQLTYQSGSGADTLWVRANDGTSWGAWSNSFTVTAPVDPGPVETVANITARHGQSFAGSSLFTYSDPFNSAATQYDVWDIGSGGGHFALNETSLGANQDNIITAAQLAQLTYQSGSGADTLWVRANDGTSWGAWSNSFTVTAPVDPGPVETVANILTSQDQSFAGSSLFTYSDPFNSAATQYDVWDTAGGGGHFALNGATLGANQDNIITAAQLAQLTYQSGSGADTLWVRANDGTAWGAWSSSFTISSQATIGAGETLQLASRTSAAISFTASTGTLQIDSSSTFTGTVAGLSSLDTLDLRDINPATVQQPTYTGNGSQGTLSVTDGTHTANITLLGNYLASTFAASSDGHGGTSIVDPLLTSANQQTVLTQPQHA